MNSFLTNPYYFFTLLISMNITFYIVSFFLSSIRAKCLKTLLIEISKSDWHTSLSILFINIAIAIPGYLLFYYEFINFNYTTNIFSIIFDFLFLLLLIDFVVFISHFLAHRIPFLKRFHLVHHEHVEFNELSLYVMHPVEAIGLGLIFTLLFISNTFNIYAVIIFLIFNWYWGVIAHFIPKDKKKSYLFTNNLFHAKHHQDGNYNYGFYTTIWDRWSNTYF